MRVATAEYYQLDGTQLLDRTYIIVRDKLCKDMCNRIETAMDGKVRDDIYKNLGQVHDQTWGLVGAEIDWKLYWETVHNDTG